MVPMTIEEEYPSSHYTEEESIEDDDSECGLKKGKSSSTNHNSSTVDLTGSLPSDKSTNSTNTGTCGMSPPPNFFKFKRPKGEDFET